MKCKNCDYQYDSNFCPNCGQEQIERFRLSDVLDLLTGSMYNFLWGSKFFNTLWLLLINPKKVVMEYINGKRKSYYNPGSLFVIFSTSYFFTVLKMEGEAMAFMQNDFYVLLAIFSSLIFTAVLTFIGFRKSELNLAEHLIISLYYNALIFSILTIYDIFILIFHFEKSGIYGIIFTLILSFYFYFRIFNRKKLISFLILIFLIPIIRILPIGLTSFIERLISYLT